MLLSCLRFYIAIDDDEKANEYWGDSSGITKCSKANIMDCKMRHYTLKDGTEVALKEVCAATCA